MRPSYGKRTARFVDASKKRSAVQQACNELAYALQRNLRDGGIRGGVTFCDANNEPLTERCEWSRMLRVAGFVPVPQGMKLYC